MLWATLFGVGFVRWAPGTFGSLGALLIWWALLAPLPWPVQLLVAVAYTLLSVWLTSVVMRRYGVKDAPEIVADEVAGMWLALLALPQSVLLALLAFSLFRVLDILKPWPIGWLDRNAPGAWGVMLDDVVAGLLTMVVLQLSLFLF